MKKIMKRHKIFWQRGR